MSTNPDTSVRSRDDDDRSVPVRAKDVDPPAAQFIQDPGRGMAVTVSLSAGDYRPPGSDRIEEGMRGGGLASVMAHLQHVGCEGGGHQGMPLGGPLSVPGEEHMKRPVRQPDHEGGLVQVVRGGAAHRIARRRVHGDQGYRACLVTRRIPNAPPAAVLLAAVPGPTVARILDSMGRAVRLLHESGGVHADLNAHNILVSEEGEGPAFVIDLDRVTLTACPAPERRTRTALRRLRRSFAKLGLDRALKDWDRLEQGFSAPPEPPPAA